MPFNVGDLVVCIDDKWECRNSAWAPPHMPVEGKVYTVRNVLNYAKPAPGLWLYEIVNPRPGINWRNGARLPDEVSFVHTSFRPVRKLSIEVFREILEPKPIPIHTVTGPKVRAGT